MTYMVPPPPLPRTHILLKMRQVKKVLRLEAENTNGEIRHLKAQLAEQQQHVDTAAHREAGAQQQLEALQVRVRVRVMLLPIVSGRVKLARVRGGGGLVFICSREDR